MISTTAPEKTKWSDSRSLHYRRGSIWWISPSICATDHDEDPNAEFGDIETKGF
jgi:hypothetical protein